MTTSFIDAYWNVEQARSNVLSNTASTGLNVLKMNDLVRQQDEDNAVKQATKQYYESHKDEKDPVKKLAGLADVLAPISLSASEKVTQTAAQAEQRIASGKKREYEAKAMQNEQASQIISQLNTAEGMEPGSHNFGLLSSALSSKLINEQQAQQVQHMWNTSPDEKGRKGIQEQFVYGLADAKTKHAFDQMRMSVEQTRLKAQTEERKAEESARSSARIAASIQQGNQRLALTEYNNSYTRMTAELKELDKAITDADRYIKDAGGKPPEPKKDWMGFGGTVTNQDDIDVYKQHAADRDAAMKRREQLRAEIKGLGAQFPELRSAHAATNAPSEKKPSKEEQSTKATVPPALKDINVETLSPIQKDVYQAILAEPDYPGKQVAIEKLLSDIKKSKEGAQKINRFSYTTPEDTKSKSTATEYTFGSRVPLTRGASFGANAPTIPTIPRKGSDEDIEAMKAIRKKKQRKEE
jgi:hypothetical protein